MTLFIHIILKPYLIYNIKTFLTFIIKVLSPIKVYFNRHSQCPYIYSWLRIRWLEITVPRIFVYIFYLFLAPVLWHSVFSNLIKSFFYQYRFYGSKSCLSSCCARLRL